MIEVLNHIYSMYKTKQVVSVALDTFLRKREKMLQQIIRSEIRQGTFDHVEEDDIIAICFRLYHDCIEGVARNNLKLMARLINGLSDKKCLHATSFQKYAKIIADLEPEEIKILAICIKHIKKNQYDFSLYDKALDEVLVELYGSGENFNRISQKTSRHHECEAVMTGLQRTGLVVSNAVIHKDYSYGRAFSLTWKFKELIEVVPNWSYLK